MKFPNSIELEIRGDRALFRDPLRSDGIPVPSCEALKGILGSIYRDPVFKWVPDSLRVMERISYVREGARIFDGKHFANVDRHYLFNVRYQLRAHFEWNDQLIDTSNLTESDEHKHFRIALRSLSRGGRRNVYLGSTDCPATVRSVHFGRGAGFYDDAVVSFGELFHSFDHSTNTPFFFNCLMDGGVITYSAQELFPRIS